jgi:hypothetical protein
VISGYRLYPVRRAASFKALPVICSASDFIAQRLVGYLIFANRLSINKNFTWPSAPDRANVTLIDLAIALRPKSHAPIYRNQVHRRSHNNSGNFRKTSKRIS